MPHEQYDFVRVVELPDHTDKMAGFRRLINLIVHNDPAFIRLQDFRNDGRGLSRPIRGAGHDTVRTDGPTQESPTGLPGLPYAFGAERTPFVRPVFGRSSGRVPHEYEGFHALLRPEGRDSSRWRKQVTRWSFTTPTACRCA